MWAREEVRIMGNKVADRIAYQLAQTGFTVVSGLARGIDTAGHRGTLKGKGRTFAVLGSALDCLYPAENAELADQIAKHGAVISEYPLGREPDRTTFPYRNRIVSGLSMGVLVVEAPFKSGALITADMALEQGRSVFAVPGRIDTPSSRGTHRLIKNGARLVDDIEDIIHEFEFLITEEAQASCSESLSIKFTEDEEAIIEVLCEGECDVDTLAQRTQLNVSKISSLLIGLEMKRIIRMLPGRIVALAMDIKLERLSDGASH